MPVETNPPLVIKLFGPFSVQLNGMPVQRLGKKGQWLLALLVLQNGREVQRSWLINWLCPDSAEPSGYFRRILNELRTALGDSADCIRTPTPATLCLEMAAVKVDVVDFRVAIKRGDRASLEQAVELYRGPLMQDCYEPWVLHDRTEFEYKCLTALEELICEAMASDDHATAVHYLRLAVAVDPTKEATYRALMRQLAKGKDYRGEAQVYSDLCKYLKRQHSQQPEIETKELHDRIQDKAKRQTRASSTDRRGEDPAPLPFDNIPVPLTPLIGRQEEIHQIKKCLLSRRLVTLKGSGGIGKTRLAIQVAREVADDYADGVCFVALADLNDPGLVTSTVAGVLGVKAQPGQPLGNTLCQSLKSRALLLVLDNCEHLIASCASLIAALLAGCKNLRVLTTSRQSLGLTGELELRVPSLLMPAPECISADEKDTVSFLQEYEAIRLFVERAQAVDSTFRLTPRNAFLVARICHRLDGIAHAIELAAACIRTLAINEIVAGLDDRFHLLTDGNRAALPRQQTLLATIDWSYDLLDNVEQRLLTRLSVFAGGWTLPAAEAVCVSQNGREAPVASGEVLKLLRRLVDKSLVEKSANGDEERTRHARYRLLETVRQYAGEKLSKTGEAEVVRRRHRDYFLALVEEAEPKLNSAEQEEWLVRLEAENANLRVILDGEADQTSLRLAGSLWYFWYMRGYIEEGYTRLLRLLNTKKEQEDRSGRARALVGAGSLAHVHGDNASARTFLQQSIDLYRELPDKSRLADALNNLALVASAQREFTEARRLHEESLAIKVDIGNKPGIASSRMNLGCLAYELRDYETARSSFKECLILFDGFGDQSTVSSLLMNLGAIAMRLEDHTASRKFHEDSLEIKRRLKDKLGIANSLLNLGELAYLKQEYKVALSRYQESLILYDQLKIEPGYVDALTDFAFLAASQDQHARAIRLWSFASQLREKMGISLGLDDQQHYEQTIGSARTLDVQAFEEAWTQGRLMTLKQAITDALETTVE